MGAGFAHSISRHRSSSFPPGMSYNLGKHSSGSLLWGPKSRALGNTTSKQKGGQPRKHRDAGKLSRLPDMPLDIMYDVSCRIVSVACLGISDNVLNIHRYSLLSARWIYSEYRGPTGLFVTFSQTRLRGWFGWPPSITSLRFDGHLRVLTT